MNTIHGPSFCGISAISLGKDVEMLMLCWTVTNLRLVSFKTVYVLKSLLVWDVMRHCSMFS